MLADYIVLYIIISHYRYSITVITFVSLIHFLYVKNLQEEVCVVGYPTGGDNISITRGIVSRLVADS